MWPLVRPRRNRKSESIRKILQEIYFQASDIIAPLFLLSGTNRKEEISSMPGIYRLSLDLLLKKAEALHKRGIQGICLFPVIEPHLKNHYGSEAFNENGLVPSAIKTLKEEIPSLTIFSDVALDPYTSHGHDGIPNEDGYIDNDKTLRALKAQALTQARSGVDVIAPSDMMDGRILTIRKALDKEGFSQTSLLSYATKYASLSLYAPFREALNSTPSFGNKYSYQLNPASSKVSELEAKLDEEEGADMLLVKPGLPYLDILYRLKQKTSLPVGAYHVSGEYAIIIAAHEKGVIDAKLAFEESMIAFKRAGADFVFTYAYDFLTEDLT